MPTCNGYARSPHKAVLWVRLPSSVLPPIIHSLHQALNLHEIDLGKSGRAEMFVLLPLFMPHSYSQLSTRPPQG